VFAHHGVQVWLTETDGPIDLLPNPTHQASIMLLGAHSRREILRSRFRVLAAMTAQVRDQGRYLGGRPPYGYRLVDAGPHPNTAHARWGRRLHRLEPDPATAGQVQWMFTQRLAGHSVAGIARALNYQHVPCPSDVDPDRNRHRNGRGRTLRTVAAILANPRYTGRQVWNRQATDHNRGPAQDRVVDPSGRDRPVPGHDLAPDVRAGLGAGPVDPASCRSLISSRQRHAPARSDRIRPGRCPG